MRYLKRFNESIGDNNEYYKEISSSEWQRSAIENQSVSIEHKSVKLLNEWFYKRFNIVKSGQYYNIRRGAKIRSYAQINDLVNFIAHEYSDEYFYVSIKNNLEVRYFICDQIDGVIKLLDDSYNS